MKQNYHWDFPMEKYDQNLNARQDAVHKMLDSKRNEPGNDKRQEKVEENKRQANATTGGFGSSQMMAAGAAMLNTI